jgi:hypothetical protein
MNVVYCVWTRRFSHNDRTYFATVFFDSFSARPIV